MAAATSDLLVTVGTYDGNVYGWDLVAKKRERSLQLAVATDAHISSVRCMRMVWTSRGLQLVTGGQDEALNVFDMQPASRKQVGSLIRHNGAVNDISFFGGKNMVTCSDDGTIAIWRTSDWECLHVLGGHRGPVRAVAIHPSGRVALSVGADRTLRLWDLIEGRSAYIKRLKVAADWARWAPDGLHFAVGEGSTAYIHRVDNAEVTGVCEGSARLSCLDFASADVLVTGGVGCALQFWALDGDELASVPTGMTGRIRALNITTLPVAKGGDGPAQVLIACVSSVGEVQLWDATQVVHPPAAAAGAAEAADVSVELVAEARVPGGQRTLCIACTPAPPAAAADPAEVARAVVTAHHQMAGSKRRSVGSRAPSQEAKRARGEQESVDK